MRHSPYCPRLLPYGPPTCIAVPTRPYRPRSAYAKSGTDVGYAATRPRTARRPSLPPFAPRLSTAADGS
eukprot:2234118-Rhodomonas_salina.1